jgi:polyisoprenoid-binding protein YceI
MLNRLLVGATVAGLLSAHAAVPLQVGPVLLAVDAAGSRVVISVGKSGVLSFAGHAHEIVGRSIGGRVTLDPANWERTSMRLELDASAFRVSSAGEPPADVPEVQRVMLSERVLDVTRFPKIVFQSRRVSRASAPGDVLIEGDVTLHGTTRPTAIRATVSLGPNGHVTARGSFTLRQSDFGMVPVTAAGGTIRVKDELAIQFVIEASPLNDASTPR